MDSLAICLAVEFRARNVKHFGCWGMVSQVCLVVIGLSKLAGHSSFCSFHEDLGWVKIHWPSKMEGLFHVIPMTDLMGPFGTFSTSSDAFIKASSSYLDLHHVFSMYTIVLCIP
jgi:hypothetical protein